MTEFDANNPVNVLMVTPGAPIFVRNYGKQLLDNRNFAMESATELNAVETIKQNALNGKTYDVVIVFAGKNGRNNSDVNSDAMINSIFELTPSAMKVVAHHFSAEQPAVAKYKNDKRVTLVINEFDITAHAEGMEFIVSNYKQFSEQKKIKNGSTDLILESMLNTMRLNENVNTYKDILITSRNNPFDKNIKPKETGYMSNTFGNIGMNSKMLIRK